MPRVFAVLAAVLLVGAVALASLLPSDLSLGQALHAVTAAGPEHLQQAVAGTFGHAVWAGLVFPVLIRPVWMLPVCAGLICVGGAVTATGRGPAPDDDASRLGEGGALPQTPLGPEAPDPHLFGLPQINPIRGHASPSTAAGLPPIVPTRSLSTLRKSTLSLRLPLLSNCLRLG